MQRKPSPPIYKKGACYALLKIYVDFLFKLSYRERELYGLERIPGDGAVIYAPNHTNALMDALAILSLDRKPKVFVARADIFRKPLLAKILTFFKIMPINRIRDGVASVKTNGVVIKRSAEVLRAHVPFCILPEGTHRAMHSLLQLGKGVFRIALLANEELGGEQPVYIVPVGLEYGNFFRYRSSLLLQIGEPINVTRYAQNVPAEEYPTLMNELKEKLSESLKDLILYIPDDEDYDATWELCNMTCNSRLQMMGLKRTVLKNRLQANKATVARIESLRNEEPEKARILLEKSAAFARERKQRHISMASVANPNPGVSLAARIVYALVLFPYYIVAFVLTLPAVLTSRFICSRLKDPAFHNSIRMVVILVVWSLVFIAGSIVALCLLPWTLALALMLALYFAPHLADEYRRWLRVGLSDLRWLRSKDLRRVKKECTSLLT